MAPRFEALNRLFESVRDSSHDFKATTDLFPPIDTDKMARTLDLPKKGAANGAADRPATSAKSHDEVEREIIDKVLEERDAAYGTVEDQYGVYARRVRNLDFEDSFGLIRQANHTSVTDFKSEVALGLDQMFIKRGRLAEASKELSTFKEKNGLERAARPSGTTGSFVKMAIILAVLLFETATNGVFLAEGSELGLLGGVVVECH